MRFLACLLLSLVAALPARAQSTTTSRFERPELGAAIHVRLTPDESQDLAFTGAVSLLGAPLPWLLLESGLNGLHPEIASTRTWFTLARFRVARVGRAAASIASGIERSTTTLDTQPQSNGELSRAIYWSLPLEAMVEARPVSGWTFRPYLGLRLPLSGYECTTRQAGLCRARPSLYLGVSVGWSHVFVREPEPLE